MCDCKEKLDKVKQANKQLTAEVERLEEVINHVINTTDNDELMDFCVASLEINNDR